MNFTKLVVLKSFFLFYLTANAQIFAPTNYPQGYFSWPVNTMPALAANFGELRPNHYHMGFDCKTDKKENLQVLAAAAGYIAKVKIEPYGFGRAIYINHPNGLTTLYAHLNEFYPELDKYVKAEQYRQKKWNIFIDIPPHLLEVAKGAQIAFSGNTGGSQGPHLHFEIRDTKTDKVLNPSLFGFAIKDNVAPQILRLALYDRCLSTYEQTPQYITLKKVNGIYTANNILINTDKVSFAISAFDTYTGSTNKNGIYGADLFDNEMPIVGFRLDSIGYDETRYLNAHIDYKVRENGGPFLQHLSRLSGYPVGVYKDVNGNGVINIEDDSLHQIRIAVLDANGNVSTLKFGIQRNAKAPIKSGVDSSSYFTTKNFHPGFINIFDRPNIQFYLPENALYDSIRFRFAEINGGSPFPIYQLHNANVPVNKMFNIKIKANSALPNKMVMHRFAGSKKDYAKALFENGWYKSSFREFGNVQLMIDTLPPTITPVGFKDGMNCSKQAAIKFVIIDNTEELLNFNATLDGNWLRFSNDKGKTFIYKFDELCSVGEHELKISVEDCVGNKSERVYKFTR